MPKYKQGGQPGGGGDLGGTDSQQAGTKGTSKERKQERKGIANGIGIRFIPQR